MFGLKLACSWSLKGRNVFDLFKVIYKEYVKLSLDTFPYWKSIKKTFWEVCFWKIHKNADILYFDSSFHSVIWNFFRSNYLKTPFSGRCFLHTTDRKKGVEEIELDYPQSRWDRDEIFLLGFWLCDLIMLVKGVIATDIPSWGCRKASAKLCFPAWVNSDANSIYYRCCYRFCNPAHHVEGVSACLEDQDVSQL